jgi:hypothetical protein
VLCPSAKRRSICFRGAIGKASFLLLLVLVLLLVYFASCSLRSALGDRCYLLAPGSWSCSCSSVVVRWVRFRFSSHCALRSPSTAGRILLGALSGTSAHPECAAQSNRIQLPAQVWEGLPQNRRPATAMSSCLFPGRPRVKIEGGGGPTDPRARLGKNVRKAYCER